MLVLGTLAYLNSLSGPFIFDDRKPVLSNPTIRDLGDLGRVLSPPREGTAVHNRPIVNLSLAINHALGGQDPRGYHLFNLVVHLLAGLLILGILGRTLKLPHLPEGLRRAADGLALVIAAIWTVHPLNTEAVSYIIQRTESMMGLFYLLTLYCLIRSATGSNWWQAGAVAACCLGMGCKETMVTAPFVLLLFDRAFLEGKLRDILKKRGGLHLGLFASLGILAFLVLPTGSRGEAAGFGQGMGVFQYAATQLWAVSHYLRLAVWPSGQVIDYGYRLTEGFWEIAPYALFIGLLLAGVVWMLIRDLRPGFLGVWFFGILAPSSSVVPLVSQTVAEKRMYLPLLAVLTGLVLGAHWIVRRLEIRRIGYALAGLGIGILTLVTANRNLVYQSRLSVWDDVVRKRPGPRAHYNRGLAYFREGRLEKAVADFTRAIELNPAHQLAWFNRGRAFGGLGRFDRAVADLSRAIRMDPEKAPAYYFRGRARRGQGDPARAVQDFTRAIELDPGFTAAYRQRAAARQEIGDREAAQGDRRKVLELSGKSVK